MHDTYLLCLLVLIGATSLKKPNALSFHLRLKFDRTVLQVHSHRLTPFERVWFFDLTCLHGMAPEYLSELCFPVKLRPSRYQLRSSQSNQLIVPPVKLSTYELRSFAVAGPTIWDNLPEYLRDPELSIDNFRRQLKTFLFAQYRYWRWHPSALETLVLVRSINLLFTLHYITLHYRFIVHLQSKTRKLCYRIDDRAMCPITWVPLMSSQSQAQQGLLSPSHL